MEASVPLQRTKELLVLQPGQNQHGNVDPGPSNLMDKGTDGDLSRYLSDRYCGGDDAHDSLKGHSDGRGFAIDSEHRPENGGDPTATAV
ncbi:hypothetical protein MAPG_10611 [Magnaporthiopsis poae ATCC 64411]|uniref:Uncharacterized protein n=1 Tax=Magnaporthiopsis poae (strain ATCC 64411 / 73-15) TaxID=644358 RepID=A0A0C4ED19_MAGP6|nr:hypothetical protein MAPG_10611 [Magnaporthiopsis poae ATCC 64411]